MMGFNGVEPPFLADFRALAKQKAPFFYDNIIKDPIMRKYIEKPFSVRSSSSHPSLLGVTGWEIDHHAQHGKHMPRQAVEESRQIVKQFAGF